MEVSDIVVQIDRKVRIFMLDFIKNALPFVIIGVCLAILFATNHNKDKENDADNYLSEGMCVGMSLGIVVSTSRNFNLGLGISLGMLIGETIGFLIKKKEEERAKKS